MTILELENAFPTPHFHFNEAAAWIEKEVYLKHLRVMAFVLLYSFTYLLVLSLFPNFFLSEGVRECKI
jgi:hypothetical protein